MPLSMGFNGSRSNECTQNCPDTKVIGCLADNEAVGKCVRFFKAGWQAAKHHALHPRSFAKQQRLKNQKA
jgi:hypothetical protein